MFKKKSHHRKQKGIKKNSQESPIANVQKFVGETIDISFIQVKNDLSKLPKNCFSVVASYIKAT